MVQLPALFHNNLCCSNTHLAELLQYNLPMYSVVVPCFKIIPYSDKRGKAPAVGKGAELKQIHTYKET